MADQNWKDLYKSQLHAKKEPPGRSKDILHRAGKQKELLASDAFLRRFIIWAWVTITCIQIMIWLIIGIASGRLPEPWWLWTAASGGVTAFLVWYITIKVRHARKRKEQ